VLGYSVEGVKGFNSWKRIRWRMESAALLTHPYALVFPVRHYIGGPFPSSTGHLCPQLQFYQVKMPFRNLNGAYDRSEF